MFKRFSYFFEIPLLFLVGHLLNYFIFPSQLGFVGISPHPYWIPIFLFSLRYGFQAGWVCGLFAAINYFLAAKYSAPDYFFEDTINYFLPISFVALGALVGGAFGSQLNKISDLMAEKKLLETNQQELKKQISDLDLIKNQLQGKIATQMSSLVTLYEGAKRLEQLDLNLLYSGVLDFVSKVLGASEAAIYLVKDQTLILHQSLGFKEYYQRPQSYGFGDGISGLAAKLQRVVSVRDFLNTEEELKLMGDALFAGPIKNGESGSLCAVLAIWQIPLLKFTSSQLSLFSFLLAWASRAVGRSNYVQQLADKAMMLPNVGVYSQAYFYERLAQEFNRSKKYYLPLAVALLKLKGPTNLDDAEQVHLKETLALLCSEHIRDLDFVASLDFVTFGIVFVTANASQINESINKIKQNFANLAPQSSLVIAQASFTPGLTSYQDLLTLARKDLLD